MVIKRFEIWLVALDPTLGSEIQKTRPCVIISPNEMNLLRTVIVAPLSSKGFDLPMRVKINFDNKEGLILLDQIRSVDKQRLVKKVGIIESNIAEDICLKLQEIFEYER
ncbi:type II toxin-antitoxin system PemK/MazF family toxin [Sulfuricurvum sp.]|uniref:type II toxin-antitoxin system PemK/MazF family toxin n=1 Tax=Sulfuricurvum sp. TaxID=2025608 RepID=UPI003C57A942